MSEEAKKESAWAKLGIVVESKEKPGSFYVKADQYKGFLMFVEMKDDRPTGNLFRIDTINLRKPYENEPTWVKEVLAVNRENGKAAFPLTLEDVIAQLMAVADTEKLQQILNQKAQTDLADE